jgi:hypothetical protein
MKVNVKHLRTSLAVVATIGVSAGVYFVGQPMFDSPFPERSTALRFFDRHYDGLESLRTRLNEDGLSFVVCYRDSVRAGTEPAGPGQELRGDSLNDYLALCGKAGSAHGWRTENGFLFYLGGAGNDAFDFNIALIRLDAETHGIPDCEAITPYGDFGKCQFQLNSVWRLDYEWYSRNRNEERVRFQ